MYVIPITRISTHNLWRLLFVYNCVNLFWFNWELLLFNIYLIPQKTAIERFTSCVTNFGNHPSLFIKLMYDRQFFIIFGIFCLLSDKIDIYKHYFLSNSTIPFKLYNMIEIKEMKFKKSWTANVSMHDGNYKVTLIFAFSESILFRKYIIFVQLIVHCFDLVEMNSIVEKIGEIWLNWPNLTVDNRHLTAIKSNIWVLSTVYYSRKNIRTQRKVSLKSLNLCG